MSYRVVIKWKFALWKSVLYNFVTFDFMINIYSFIFIATITMYGKLSYPFQGKYILLAYLEQGWPTQMIIRVTLEMHHNSAGHIWNYTYIKWFDLDLLYTFFWMIILIRDFKIHGYDEFREYNAIIPLTLNS